MGTLDRPTAGTVEVAGEDVVAARRPALSALRARRIGFVFQQFHLLDGMSALDNVATGLLYTGVGAGDAASGRGEVLERVGLGHRLAHHPTQLSGGERQRVAIARALVATAGDRVRRRADRQPRQPRRRRIVTLLRELHADGATVVVITHDREIAAADAAARRKCRDGRVVADA